MKPASAVQQSERCILGSVLYSNSCWPQASELKADDFSCDTHRRIFRRIASMVDDGRPADWITVSAELHEHNELDTCGGTAYIGGLLDDAFPENIAEYIRAVRKAAVERHIARQVERLAATCKESPEKLVHLREQTQQLLESLDTMQGDARVSTKLFQSAAQVCRQSDNGPAWIAPGLAAVGSMTNLDAKIKLGKTTFVLELVSAALDGRDFLGKSTKKTAVVYLTEQPRTSLRQALRRARLNTRDELQFLFWSDVLGKPWPDIAAIARAKCAEIGAGLLIVDTIGQFAGFQNDDENSSGPWMEALRPLQAILADGVCVINCVHSRKSGGEVGDSARGSSAGGGVADILLSLRKPEGNHGPNFRKIESLSRFDESPSGLIIELTADGYVARGDSDALAADETRAKLYEALPTDESTAKNMEQLTEEIGGKRSTLSRVIKTDAGIQKIGKGGRSDPFRYYRPQTQGEISNEDSQSY